MTEAVRTPFDPADETAIAPSHGRDLFSKFDPLIAEREALLSTGVRDPFGLVMEKVLSPTRAIIKGKETILLGTYNYMGMTFDPDVIQAGKDALDAYGAGTTGSRVLNGTYQGHREVEDALKDFYGTKHAMVFSTGYQANLGLMSTIAGKEDYIILDADSHASIYDGCALGNAQIVRFRHNSVEDLDKRLGRLPAEGGRLVVLGRSEERQQRQDCLFGTQLPQSTPSVCGSPHLAAGRSCLVQRGITGHADQVTDMLALKSEPRTIIKPPGRIVAVSLANTQ